MAAFDFITDDQFRASLESDYNELNLCLEAGAWKAACVLAGSIIEAVLVDYLLARRYQKKDPLKMELGEMITACQQEGILSDKTVGLTSAIRLYRNLIHPGRAVRLGEIIDENEARLAHPLVDIVVREVAAHKEKTYGPTADQIVSKVESDPSAISVARHLIRSAKPVEIERLLLDVIPRRYFELVGGGALETEAPLPSLEECFRSAVGAAPSETKVRMAQHYVAILKEEGAWSVLLYEAAFFRGKDLQYLQWADQELVKEHVFSRLEQGVPSTRLLRTLEGIGPFLKDSEVSVFLGAIIRGMLSWETPVLEASSLRKAGLERIEGEYWQMQATAKTEACNWLRKWLAMSDQKELRPADEVQLADQMRYLLTAFEASLSA
jgi:hypothetical protein